MFNINKIMVEWIKNLIWIYKFCFIVFFTVFFSVHDLLPARLGWPGGTRVDLEGPVLTWKDSGWSGGPGLTWRDQCWPGGTRVDLGWPGGTSVDLEGLRLTWRTWVDMEGPGLTWRNQGWPGGTSVDLEGLRLTWRDQGQVDLNEGLLNELVVVCMLLVFHFQKFKMFWCCMCIMSDLWLMLTAKVDWVERSSEHASSHEEYLESWLPAALGAV